MLIPFPTEIAACFDFLAILQVKYSKTHSAEIQSQIEFFQSEISKQITYDKAIAVSKSPEYKNLFEINKKIFELIDECHERNSGIPLKAADDLNKSRYDAKIALQEKHFSAPLKEIKIGYN